ncbi:hypothetical protein [Engelhardtia mirabilis]|uniref:Uncharacterized protein n=1 Tax=Engelhardtia mirabilis TaxID=2528011 RepID=A0A518BJH1_9BACT|nr:hypothetical protein Pla133_22090 [Planctomycetes bacterium Pla133]QDV01458.1 hypothetical protein Pla86_22090 [Planctomycetes bacterium Pla86]
MTFDWLDVAAAGGTDFTPTATADWRRAVECLPVPLCGDPRLDELHAVVDRWGERRGALRCDPLLEDAARARMLRSVDAEAAREVEPFLPLLRESPILLQHVYVLAKQTQEEARLHFLPRALVRFGERLADVPMGSDAELSLRRALRATLDDLLARYEGLALVAGELIHEGVQTRRGERARAGLEDCEYAALVELGRQRGLCDLDPEGEDRGHRLDAQLDSQLRRHPINTPALRAVARRAFEEGRNDGHELALDAYGRSLELLEALSRRVDLRRMARLREGLEGTDERLRQLTLAELARHLHTDHRGQATPEQLARQALAAVLPKRGPRRRFAECLLDGDRDGARATLLLLELKGLPFDRGRKVEALYREAGCEGIARLEQRFAAEYADTARDATWLRLVKGASRWMALALGDAGRAERLRPVGPGLPLATLLDLKLRPADRAAVERLRRGDRAGAELGLLERAVEQRSAEGVVACLEGVDPEDLEEVCARFLSDSGRPLDRVLHEVLAPTPLRDLALHTVRGEARLARAARLRAALAEIGGVTLEDAFAGLSSDERHLLVGDYDLVYAGAAQGTHRTRLRGIFEQDLRRLVGRDVAELVSVLVRHGGLPPEDLARYYMLGLGTNVAGLVDLLRRFDREGIADLERRYDRKYRLYGARALARRETGSRLARAIAAERARFGPAARLVDVPLVGSLLRRVSLIDGLVGDLRGELSGDGWFDVRDALRGKPEVDRPGELASRLEERRAHEFSGRLMRSARFFKQLRRAVDTSLASARSVFPVGVVDGEPIVAQLGQRLRYHLYARRVLLAFDRFRAAKNRAGAALGDRLGGVGATLGALLGAFVERSLSGQVSLLTLALAGTVGAFIGKTLPKKLIAGDALGTEEIGLDLVHALIEGAGRMFSRLRRFGRFAVDGIQRGLGRTVFKVGAKRTIDQVTRGLASRLGARQDRLPQLRVTSFRLRDDLSPITSGAARARSNVIGAALDHEHDAGLERVFDGLVGQCLWPLGDRQLPN